MGAEQMRFNEEKRFGGSLSARDESVYSRQQLDPDRSMFKMQRLKEDADEYDPGMRELSRTAPVSPGPSLVSVPRGSSNSYVQQPVVRRADNDADPLESHAMRFQRI